MPEPEQTTNGAELAVIAAALLLGRSELQSHFIPSKAGAVPLSLT